MCADVCGDVYRCLEVNVGSVCVCVCVCAVCIKSVN